MTIRQILLNIIIVVFLVSFGCNESASETSVDPLANYSNSLPTSDTATVPIIKKGFVIEGGGYYLTWQNCPFAAQYEVEAGNVLNNWNWKLVSVTGGTGYNTGEVPGDIQQKFRVRAVCESYNSKWSEISVP